MVPPASEVLDSVVDSEVVMEVAMEAVTEAVATKKSMMMDMEAQKVYISMPRSSIKSRRSCCTKSP